MLAACALKDREVRTALKRGERIEMEEWVDGVAVRNANAEVRTDVVRSN